MIKKRFRFKVVMLGETSVGKSSILDRLIRNEFSHFREPTIGSAFQTQEIDLDDMIVKLEFWDTAGQERYKSLTSLYYHNAKAAVVVYDVTNQESLDKAKFWIKEIIDKGDKDSLIVLVGNKIDLNKNTKNDEILKEIIKENDLMFFEVSAKTGTNVTKAFIDVSKKLILTENREEDCIQNFVIQESNRNKPSCCYHI